MKQLIFEERLRYTPPSFHIYITFKCNLRCSYCQWLLKDKNVFDNAPTMSLEEFDWILDTFGIGTIAIQGGEPTVHPEFSEIIRSAKSRNIKLKISTNGTLIKERINDLKLIDSLNVSFNGADYESFHRTTRGTEKQFDNMISGLELLNKNQIPFKLSFVVFEENLDQIEEVIRFAKHFQPEILNLPAGDAQGSSLTSITLNSPKVLYYLMRLFMKIDYPFPINLPVLLDPDSEIFNTEICPYPWQKAYISPIGEIGYCCHLPFNPKIGNIFKGYKFNSDNMVNFRKSMMEYKFSNNCLNCHRRFGLHIPGFFDIEKKKWVLPSKLLKILKELYP